MREALKRIACWLLCLFCLNGCGKTAQKTEKSKWVKSPCPNCKGEGKTLCPLCQGTTKILAEVSSSKAGQPCQFCKEPNIKYDCGFCWGKGQMLRRTDTPPGVIQARPITDDDM